VKGPKVKTPLLLLAAVIVTVACGTMRHESVCYDYDYDYGEVSSAARNEGSNDDQDAIAAACSGTAGTPIPSTTHTSGQ
jgi:hypothetical protein